jgi:hypothetical protein
MMHHSPMHVRLLWCVDKTPQGTLQAAAQPTGVSLACVCGAFCCACVVGVCVVWCDVWRARIDRAVSQACMRSSLHTPTVIAQSVRCTEPRPRLCCCGCVR